MDPIVLSYHDVCLRKSDLETLQGRNWLNDAIISFMFEYYQQETYKQNSEHIHFFDPSIVQLIKQNPSFAPDILKPHFKDDNKDVFLFPINDNSENEVGGTHWSLLVCDRSARNLSHYDSSCSKSNQSTAKLVSKTLSSTVFKGCVYCEADAKVQTNLYDCGVHLLMNAEKAISQKFSFNRERFDGNSSEYRSYTKGVVDEKIGNSKQ